MARGGCLGWLWGVGGGGNTPHGPPTFIASTVSTTRFTLLVYLCLTSSAAAGRRPPGLRKKERPGRNRRDMRAYHCRLWHAAKVISKPRWR